LQAWRAADLSAGRKSLLIIVPRHPHRGAQIGRLARDTGLSVGLRSEGADLSALDVYVADTIGELGLFFRLATLSFLGGSLVPGAGGHNPLEPARLGCPFVTGPNFANWPLYRQLLALEATRCVTPGELESPFAQATIDPNTFASMAARALRFVTERDGKRAPESAGSWNFSAHEDRDPPLVVFRDDPPMRVTRALAWPLSMIWAAATAYRIARARPVDPGVPVICVGNPHPGRIGKTPVVREIARRLRAAGREVHVLSRGHGGPARGPHSCRPGTAHVGRCRGRAADDGRRRPGLGGPRSREGRIGGGRRRRAGDRHGRRSPEPQRQQDPLPGGCRWRDSRWRMPFGDGSVFPRGPLREPLAAGLARARAVVVVLPSDLPVSIRTSPRDFPTRLCSSPTSNPSWRRPTARRWASPGIAKPWRVERALKAAGCRLADFAPLATTRGYRSRP